MPTPVHMKSPNGPGITLLWPKEGEPEAGGSSQDALDRMTQEMRGVVRRQSGPYSGYPTIEAWLASEPQHWFENVCVKVALL